MNFYQSDFLSVNGNLILISMIAIASFISLINITRSRLAIFKVIYFAIFSNLVCLTYLLLDAPDVAMTEAAIGVCVSIVILILFVQKCKPDSRKKYHKFDYKRFIYSSLSILVLFLLFEELNSVLPNYGDPLSPVNSNDSSYYIENTMNQTKVPAFVAAILASYRGFDTMGETIVVLIAGLGFMLIMAEKKEEEKMEEKGVTSE